VDAKHIRKFDDYPAADAFLQSVWEKVKDRHPTSASHAYVASHWPRYVHLLASLPSVTAQTSVLEIGASIVSSALKHAGAYVAVAYHELEPEWAARHREEGIESVAVELLRDVLPWPGATFDVILCDQVIEHFPLAPDFLMQQMLFMLKPGGRLVISVPNFASWEKRWALWRGYNPQEPMDRSFIYYAHHREMVMPELEALVRENGGEVVSRLWTDFGPPTPAWTKACHALCALAKGHLGQAGHMLFPALRDYLVIHATQAPGAAYPEERRKPPMASSPEFRRA
jgi:SAM-dependent methyltransferase